MSLSIFILVVHMTFPYTSSSYDLSTFSSKARSAVDAGQVVMCVDTSSPSLGDDWVDASTVPNSFLDGVVMTIDRGQLEAAAEHALMLLFGGRNTKRKKGFAPTLFLKQGSAPKLYSKPGSMPKLYLKLMSRSGLWFRQSSWSW
jgi:hypothetical protein